MAGGNGGGVGVGVGRRQRVLVKEETREFSRGPSQLRTPICCHYCTAVVVLRCRELFCSSRKHSACSDVSSLVASRLLLPAIHVVSAAAHGDGVSGATRRGMRFAWR